MYQAFMVLLAVATLFTLINRRFLKLQLTIGLMIQGMIMSALLLAIRHWKPEWFAMLPHVVEDIDFKTFLMNGILSFLLFAGAIHINVAALKKERLTVFLFSIVGTLISTLVVGWLSWWVFGLLGLDIPLLHCMLFGALISPTDPIAVLAIFKDYKVREDITIKVEGESLFNDGVGIVIFITVAHLLAGSSENISITSVTTLFLREAAGGIAFGLLLGLLAIAVLRLIRKDPETAVMTTLVVATGGYATATFLDISGALAMVASGLMIGNWINKQALLDTRQLVSTFWGILDGVFNSVLFVLMGLVILLIDPTVVNFAAAAIIIIVVLIARFVSVSIPYVMVDRSVRRFPWFDARMVSIMTWSGLRGALAFALALSVDPNYHGHFFIFITYTVVAFSIIVQGLTIGKVVRFFKIGAS